ncbi:MULTISPECIES: GlxA family transcriptional regulator [Aliivibrio]|uniref:Helix-turn-helix domain-containing protein n=1 Tax=Aliivibrio finisterrensis TaxID=511998 RepID=A0A4Q5KT52_9GAMM|nr:MULTISPECIES: helix-turn-helix domain-containing protein [Aliivibrio]MDD9179455.1 helix-turn-helix domain-containing protein [Aliivibrio sp. A6]MDD9202585.1 helix-turn-helix domain-containing protein [Aliivibrio sp. S4MY1]RYU50912.1 helix-turn-helix domain-containing protein [Aliivibrio finisterrensis]RYU51613.1 helix-turn-helix domain-containing protein [Aliivibrio finisterrensis]RYU57423.1 helix-turn-helix domain-containing protein [Aliivibrio finisterrensis]
MINIYFLISSNVHLLDLASSCQTFDEANKLGCNYKLHYISFSKSISSHQGLYLTNLTYPPTNIINESIIIACASGYEPDIYSDEVSQQTANWLRSHYIKNKSLVFMGICTGAFLLGKAGILNGHKCTTHHSYINKLSEQFSETEVLKDIMFVKSGNVYTSAGVTAAIDLSLDIVEKHYSTQISIAVARDLLVHRRRMSSDPQISNHIISRNHISPLIHSIEDYISIHFKTELTVTEIAKMNNISIRHLQRNFKECTGSTISDYINKMKLEEARHLIKEGISVVNAAYEVGFKQASSLRKLWKKHYNSLPSEIKKKKV